MLASNDLRAGYGAVEILHGVSYGFAEGTLTALIGPNGCGKSTYLKTLARLLDPTGGVALLDGRAIRELPTREVAKQLGILPQQPLVPDAITAYELVSRGRYPHQGLLRQWTAKDADAVARAMALTGTAEFADLPVDSLSGGQRQRCWVAMTLAQEVRIVLLDEPTTFLDIRHQIEILELLADLTRAGDRTVVVVLHDLNLAAAYADALVIMNEGTIQAAGSVEDIFTADNIGAAFGISVHLVRHPDTGRPWCMPADRVWTGRAAARP